MNFDGILSHSSWVTVPERMQNIYILTPNHKNKTKVFLGKKNTLNIFGKSPENNSCSGVQFSQSCKLVTSTQIFRTSFP